LTRRTVQRDAIINVLRSTKSHPTAEWVYEKARELVPDISLGTVYRNLSSMRQEGKILAIEQAGAEARFDGNPANHYHFRCEACGGVFDIDEPVDIDIDRRVTKSTGFEVSFHILEFRGRCHACVIPPATTGESGNPACKD
jgi:Fur family transcriptional regulator, peroxide stress response regulator